MKLFATTVLATTVFAATKSRFTDDAAAGLVIEHDVSIGSRSRREESTSVSCNNAKYYQQIFRYKSTSHGYEQCVFSKLLEHHKTNIRRAMWLIYKDSDEDKQRIGKHLVENADDGFHGIIGDWRILTGGVTPRESQETLDCGWKPLDITTRLAHKMDLEENAIREGFFRSCGGMCNLIDFSVLKLDNELIENSEMIENSKLIVKETLNMFLMIIADYFGIMAQIKADTKLGQKELPQCVQKKGYWNQKEEEYIKAEWINSEKKPCKNADKCGQIVRNIFRKVSLFEDFIGPVPSLVEYDDAYKNDMTRLEGDRNIEKIFS